MTKKTEVAKPPDLTPKERGVLHALYIQRHEDPRRWRELVDAIKDEEERAAADRYLRDIITRMKVVARLSRDNRRR